MSIAISSIITDGDYFRRSTETNELTSAKQLEAAALAVEDVHSQAMFRFTQRRQTFDYLTGETDYSLLESLNIQDFRGIKDIRNVDENAFAFDYIDPNQFDTSQARYPDRANYTVEFRDGQPVLRISQVGAGSSMAVHQASDYDSDGTWAADATSDALNIGTDTNIYRANGGSIKFDVDVSQSANNYAIVSVADMTAVDLSAYQGHGIIRMWVYLPDVLDDTSILTTSVELRWGSSASAYWSCTITRPVDHNTWVDRWNLCEFKWNESAETGTVDETAIDYLFVKIAYGATQTDDTGFRINDIRIFQPYEMELLYFSNYTVKITSTGIWKARATATTDELLCPDIYKDVYVAAYNYYVTSFLYPADDKRIQMYDLRYKTKLAKMIAMEGERPKMPVRKLTPSLSWPSD